MKIPNETKAQQKSRMKKIIGILAVQYPFAKIQLDYETPFELLVSTILSAQCTDDRVNIVAGKLFKKYNRPEQFVELPDDELEKLIFSTGYYKAKAKNIKAASKVLLVKFRGELPQTMDELLTIPGVGRKTANVLLGHLFDVPGIVVDTHVIRISNRLGFADTTNAEKIEYALMELIPKTEWVVFTHYLINHGRKTCTARKPKCGDCRIRELCPSKEV